MYRLFTYPPPPAVGGITVHNDDLYCHWCVCMCRLFTYPPPPAVGGITVHNEDLYCLNDGEFLNDVIIEFYIK